MCQRGENKSFEGREISSVSRSNVQRRERTRCRIRKQYPTMNERDKDARCAEYLFSMRLKASILFHFPDCFDSLPTSVVSSRYSMFISIKIPFVVRYQLPLKDGHSFRNSAATRHEGHVERRLFTATWSWDLPGTGGSTATSGHRRHRPRYDGHS